MWDAFLIKDPLKLQEDAAEAAAMKRKRPTIGYIAPFPRINPEFQLHQPRPIPRSRPTVGLSGFGERQMTREQLTKELMNFSKEFGERFGSADGSGA